jgi:hypothetical protein
MKPKQKYLIIIGLVVIVLVYAIICGYSNSTVTTSVIKTEIPADDSLMLRSIQLSNDSSTLSRKTTIIFSLLPKYCIQRDTMLTSYMEATAISTI